MRETDGVVPRATLALMETSRASRRLGSSQLRKVSRLLKKKQNKTKKCQLPLFAFSACLFKFPRESSGVQPSFNRAHMAFVELALSCANTHMPCFLSLERGRAGAAGRRRWAAAAFPQRCAPGQAAAWTAGSFSCVPRSGGWIFEERRQRPGLPARTGCIFPGSIPVLTRLPPGPGGWGLGVGVSGQPLNLNGGGGWGTRVRHPGVGWGKCTQQDHSPISWGADRGEGRWRLSPQQ